MSQMQYTQYKCRPRHTYINYEKNGYEFTTINNTGIINSPISNEIFKNKCLVISISQGLEFLRSRKFNVDVLSPENLMLVMNANHNHSMVVNQYEGTTEINYIHC